MERIIVTVKREQEAQVRDLEVPAGVQAAQLAVMIASALHWDRDSAGGALSYRIEAEPPGRLLQPEETLIKAGVGDGAWLTFIPVQDHQPSEAPRVPSKHVDRGAPEESPPPERQGPVLKWESLFPAENPEMEDKPTEQDQGITDDSTDSPYIWKELDL